MDTTNWVSFICNLPGKPDLYEPGEPLFWNDPHISKSMLEAHLSPDNDIASRKHETIDREVEHLTASGILRPGDRVLDLGCGPGLYSSRLAAKGIAVTGIDQSANSLDYARNYAAEHNLAIDYRLMDFFDIDFHNEFDAVIQVNGELNVFSDEQRDDLIARLRRALKPDGLLIFDATTRITRSQFSNNNDWYASGSGFWRPHDHLVLTRGFDYPDDSVWLSQYIVIDFRGVTVYHNWFHDYDRDTIHEVINNAGFEVMATWDDLSGSRYTGDGEWLAIVAKKTD